MARPDKDDATTRELFELDVLDKDESGEVLSDSERPQSATYRTRRSFVTQVGVLAIWFNFLLLNGENFLRTVHIFGTADNLPAWMSAFLILTQVGMILTAWLQFCYIVVGRHRCYVGLYIFLLGICICCSLGDFSALFKGLASALDNASSTNSTGM